MLVFELSSDDAVFLGPHRTRGGWEICEETGSGKESGAGRLWLRCPDGEATEAVTEGLPCAGRYRVEVRTVAVADSAAAGRSGLVPLGKTLPVGKMPAGPWVKLADWLKVEGPQAVLPGRCQERLAVELARSGREEPTAALLLTLGSLTAWAESASRLRMARLRFAVSASASAGKTESSPQALVIGEPPPAAAGQACYARGRLLLPCGWEFAPPLRAGWVEESLALPPGAVALFAPSGEVELLEQESFVPLSLAAVRRTGRALGLAFPSFRTS